MTAIECIAICLVVSAVSFFVGYKVAIAEVYDKTLHLLNDICEELEHKVK